jgi:hypothetical protein
MGGVPIATDDHCSQSCSESLGSWQLAVVGIKRADVCRAVVVVAGWFQVLDAGFGKLGVKQQSQIWLQVGRWSLIVSITAAAI